MKDDLYATRGLSDWTLEFEDGYVEQMDYIFDQNIIKRENDKEIIILSTNIISDDVLSRFYNGINIKRLTENCNPKTVQNNDFLRTEIREVKIYSIIRKSDCNSIGEMKIIFK